MKSDELKGTMTFLRIVATTTSLIGTLFLLSLFADPAWSEDPPRPGFGGGAAGNPFAPPPTTPGGGSFFDEDDDITFPEDNYPFPPGGAGTTPPSGAGANTAPSRQTPSTNQGSPGISVGGQPSGGVIAGKEVAPLKIDDETAEGSKEIITDFNFPDADVLDIAKALGKLTGKNFIYDKDVKGKITITSNGPITVGDAWKAFLTSLDINGFALIPSGKFIRIARQRDARDKQLKTYTGDYSPDTDALITRLFPLKYLTAEEVARNFRSFMPANSRIIPYEQTNTVIVTDTGSNIAKLQKLLEILDIEGYDAGIEVIYVKYASASELSKLIDTLLPGQGGGAPGAPRFGASKFNSRRTKEGGIINTIIADERTNTLIVHANSRGADQVRALVTKLDQKLPAQTGGGKVHVLFLQFAEAENIANTLNNLSQGAGRSSSQGPAGGTGVNPVQGNLFEGNIKISPDKSTNSVVVTASPSDFVTIQRVVNKLDIPRDQVYAEIVIMEIIMSRDFQFSSNIINPTNGLGLTPNTDLFDFIQNPLGSKGAILGFKSGGKVDMKVGGQTVSVSGIQALIKAIQTRSNSNVLATPQILALDNTEAQFETAEKIPVPTTTAVQGAVSTSITKENVALSISIKPQINKIANFVKLEISTKLEDFSGRELPTQVSQLALATISRSAKTSIVVGDSDTVVLGGLVRDIRKEQVSKIPILGDIPLLGWLFSARKTENQKSNLLIFITPTIIRQYENIRAMLDKKLKQRDEFIENFAGGEDPLRGYRDEMIRNLPDIKDITQYKPKKSVTIGDEDDISSDVDSTESPALDTASDMTKPNPDVPTQPPGNVPFAPSTAPATPQSGTPAPTGGLAP